MRVWWVHASLLCVADLHCKRHTNFMPTKANQVDNRTPPGFAFVVHHRPYQLIATLVCQYVTAKLYRLQLLAHSYQLHASDVQVYQPVQAQSLHNQMLHTCWQLQSTTTFMVVEKKRRTVTRSSSRCLIWHSPAIAELVQQVLLLIGQALLDAICDHTVLPTRAVLENFVLCSAGPARPGLHACILSRDWSCQLQLQSYTR